MFARDLTEQLRQWRNNPRRKPLVLRGARQVGKTTLVKEFGQEFDSFISLNLETDDSELFRRFSNILDLWQYLCLKHHIVQDKSKAVLLFIDEIQEEPKAVAMLRYFYEDLPWVYVIAAGSRLHSLMKQHVSFPVGRVEYMTLRPCSFVEYINAKEGGQWADMLRSISVPDFMHEEMISAFNTYALIGGMPEAVKKYVETGALQAVRRIQNRILSGYDIDFSKHAPAEQVQRIRMVWKSIPSQLFKENKKFIYGTLRKGARAKDFELAIEWLANSGLVYKVARCNKLSLPLAIYEDLSAFKLYFVDVGLLGAMVDTEASQIIVSNNAFTEYKGGMTEQYVLQQYMSHGISPIYYHKTDDSRLEIDFVIQSSGSILPVEVKAAGNVRANSLTTLLSNNPEMQAIRYSMLPYRKQNQLTCIPLYMV